MVRLERVCLGATPSAVQGVGGGIARFARPPFEKLRKEGSGGVVQKNKSVPTKLPHTMAEFHFFGRATHFQVPQLEPKNAIRKGRETGGTGREWKRRRGRGAKADRIAGVQFFEKNDFIRIE